MPPPTQRKTNPKVVDGRARPKSRREPSPSLWTVQALALERDRPGRGFRHVLTRRELLAFFDLLPDWLALSRGLLGVRLTARRDGADGLDTYCAEGAVISLAAWERDLTRTVAPAFFEAHRALFDRLGAPCERHDGNRRLRFTVETLRAYQLMHVFLHELGHQQDCMSTRRRRAVGGGETYAEGWALKRVREVRDRYEAVFGPLPSVRRS
ncbi:MAG: hypothetical protein AAF676_02835 [Pseudomonadota bacterium]